VLSLDASVPGILSGLRKRQFMITPGFRARLTRFLARKSSGLFHRIFDQRLSRAYAEEHTQRQR
jgi:hypothetical protein